MPVNTIAILFAVLLLTASNARAENVVSMEASINLQANQFNSEGVAALQKMHGTRATDAEWEAVFDRFRAALRLEPNFGAARQNLAIAHNNKALRRPPKLALNEFHKSLYLDDSNVTTQENLNALLKVLHVDPACFDDRVKLADKAMAVADWTGAVVEYRVALKIREDAAIRTRLEKALMALDKKAD